MIQFKAFSLLIKLLQTNVLRKAVEPQPFLSPPQLENRPFLNKWPLPTWARGQHSPPYGTLQLVMNLSYFVTPLSLYNINKCIKKWIASYGLLQNS